MLAYATVGSNDLARSKAFFSSVLQELGGSLLMEDAAPSTGYPMLVFGRAMHQPLLIVTTPADGTPARPGNGTMVALACQSDEQVQRLHAAALAAGGADEGMPGPRGSVGFYCGYFRDLDGNKFNAFRMIPKGD